MRDISHKVNTLRVAEAKAILRVSPSTIEMIHQGKVPKGNPLDVAKVAAVQAAKNTSQIIPYCHPMPVEFVGVEFMLDEDSIAVSVTVKAIYKTGVEMEAMTAASVAALTIYDMLKMVDDLMQIESVFLVSKTGGKSDFERHEEKAFKAAVVVMSDSVARNEKEDRSGKIIFERLRNEGFDVEQPIIVPDDRDKIATTIKMLADDRKVDLIVTTGGTGLGPRDCTPEAVSSLIERQLPGIAESMRAYGQDRNPYSMFSRSLAGARGTTIVICLPGSTGGVKDGLATLFPYVFHAFDTLSGGGHAHQDKDRIKGTSVHGKSDAIPSKS